VELDQLPGIGPVLARRIVEYRRLHGPFRRLEELRGVRGVGPRLLERLRPRVRLDAAPAPGP
jgi:competence protein ComEA